MWPGTIGFVKARWSVREERGACFPNNTTSRTNRAGFTKAERVAAVQLRDQDRISDEVLQKLLRELDLQDARPLASYPEESDEDVRH
jgi:hypothetical protein